MENQQQQQQPNNKRGNSVGRRSRNNNQSSSRGRRSNSSSGRAILGASGTTTTYSPASSDHHPTTRNSTSSPAFPFVASEHEEPEPYVPPSIDSGLNSNTHGSTETTSAVLVGTSNTGRGVEHAISDGTDDHLYVTQPPKLLAKSGLTGKISTLFRRDSSSQAAVPKKEKKKNLQNGGGKKQPQQQNQQPQQHLSSSSSYSKSPPRSFRAPHETLSSGGGGGEEDGTDDQAPSPTSMLTPRKSVSAASSGGGQRIFYSSNADDSDDSYESKFSKYSSPSGGGGGGHVQGGSSQGAHSGGGYSQFGEETDDPSSPRIQRFRGFSTSIKSLFLDEPLVCASVGCFGLLLSNRTEYLMTLRNQRRGTLSPRNSERRHKLPSRIVAYGLVLTILLMFSTFLIWGFGTGHGLASGYYQGYDYYDVDDQNTNSNSNYNNNNYGDDSNNKYDDGGAAAAYDDAKNGDDGNNNNNYYYQNNNNNDDANNYGDDNNNRRRRRRDKEQQPQRQKQVSSAHVTVDSSVYFHPHRHSYHTVHGIFKLRDVQENVWDPVWDLVQSEWNNRETVEDAGNSSGVDSYRRREREQYTYYDIVDDDTQKAEYTQQQRDIGANIRTALLFSFLLFLGVLGRRRRMRTRFYLVRARAQEDHLYYASAKIGTGKSFTSTSTGQNSNNSMYPPASPNTLQAAAKGFEAQQDRENQYEGACSHTLCGCYPVDELPDDGSVEEVQVRDTGIFRLKRRPHHEDIVARGFNCCMAACCGVLCKCWFQCLSVCALAQEAREIRLLLPTRYQRIDFITHQPFHEYHQNVTDLRLGWMGKTRRVHGFLPHYHALSRLSRYIVVAGTLTVIALVCTLMFNPRAAFSWQDAVVLAATFLQSFLVLFIVHWIFHKSDLSLDAVIKLFAAGFFIAVPSAFFFEGLLVNIVLFGAWGVYSIFALALGDRFSSFIFVHWRLVWILGELFNAYVVAAITEEMCKYYTFRAVEHPDLMFLTGLNREEQDDNVMVGGVVKYPFGSHQVSEQIRVENDDDSCSQRSSRSNKAGSKKKVYSTRGLEDDLLREAVDKVNFQMEEPDVRTYRQKAMAITTGMISVAVGLACAENMLYVFVLGGALANDKGEEQHKGDVIEAWIVLFFRSIFPIHALAAAMQSINMIRKFVETSEHSGHRIGVGRIILPAVILHGSFDAVLMGINVFIETAWDQYLEENEGRIGEDPPYNSLTLNIVAWISITGIMILGIIWYFRENRLQRERLKDLEEKDKVKWAQSGGEPEGELEIV